MSLSGESLNLTVPPLTSSPRCIESDYEAYICSSCVVIAVHYNLCKDACCFRLVCLSLRPRRRVAYEQMGKSGCKQSRYSPSFVRMFGDGDTRLHNELNLLASDPRQPLNLPQSPVKTAATEPSFLTGEREALLRKMVLLKDFFGRRPFQSGTF